MIKEKTNMKRNKKRKRKRANNYRSKRGGGKSDRMKCTFGHNFQPIRNLTNFKAFTHQNPNMNYMMFKSKIFNILFLLLLI